jgi:hypothetical protein
LNSAPGTLAFIGLAAFVAFVLIAFGPVFDSLCSVSRTIAPTVQGQVCYVGLTVKVGLVAIVVAAAIGLGIRVWRSGSI